ncbi:hypothetical protein [Williamsia maris]|uniref:hypothetical protein n=1 Tax=Williamsia maris TaxID=72806 RepID=UPI0020A5A8CE|nr:hypothetical protein [Williamsia maris]
MKKRKASRTATTSPTQVAESSRKTIEQETGTALSKWEPTVGCRAVVHPHTDQAVAGSIVEDFGEFAAHPVDANNIRIAEAARRWAILTADGNLVFADTHQLAAHRAQPTDPASANPGPTRAERGPPVNSILQTRSKTDQWQANTYAR